MLVLGRESLLWVETGHSSALAQSEDEESAKRLVESCLITVGNGDLDVLPGMFVLHANIGTASLRYFADSIGERDTWALEKGRRCCR